MSLNPSEDQRKQGGVGTAGMTGAAPVTSDNTVWQAKRTNIEYMYSSSIGLQPNLSYYRAASSSCYLPLFMHVGIHLSIYSISALPHAAGAVDRWLCPKCR